MLLISWLFVLLFSSVSSSGAGRNAYDILGVGRKAGSRQIKKAFRELTKRWHPDRNQDNLQEAENKFRDIVWAHDILTNDTLRNAYDKYGEDGVKNMCTFNMPPLLDHANTVSTSPTIVTVAFSLQESN